MGQNWVTLWPRCQTACVLVGQGLPAVEALLQLRGGGVGHALGRRAAEQQTAGVDAGVVNLDPSGLAFDKDFVRVLVQEVEAAVDEGRVEGARRRLADEAEDLLRLKINRCGI